MGLAIAIQMDPIEKIDIDGDSTFALAIEAQKRGHSLFYYGPRDLMFWDGEVSARASALTVRPKKGDHFSLGPPETIALSGVDVVLM
ncbi:MAG: glutathione synthase, partial [Alphaproteobacteria bacterium]|nr:glutathione synthase [Alphaproteobacteria bacterium]